MEVLRSPPSTSSFVPLAEHQAHTPASFYSGPPVLHYVSERCKVVILERDLLAAPAINAMRGEVLRNTTATGNENGVNGSGQAAVSQNGEEEEGKEVVIGGIDVWVTSEYVSFFLFPYKIRDTMRSDGFPLIYLSSAKYADPYGKIHKLTKPQKIPPLQALHQHRRCDSLPFYLPTRNPAPPPPFLRPLVRPGPGSIHADCAPIFSPHRGRRRRRKY